MAPDAPAPTFDSHGNQVAAWVIRAEYNPLIDLLTLSMTQEAGPYHKAKRVYNTYDVNDVEDLLADMTRAVRIMGARRLF